MSWPDELTEELLPVELPVEDMLPVVVLPSGLLVDNELLIEVESLSDGGTLLEASSAGQVPQSPLKKPHGLPRRQVQEPS